MDGWMDGEGFGLYTAAVHLMGRTSGKIVTPTFITEYLTIRPLALLQQFQRAN